MSSEATIGERGAARGNADIAITLRGAAAQFREFLSKWLAAPAFAQLAQIVDYRADHDEPECFVIDTPFGRVYTRFSLAFYGSELVGRYEFFRMTAGDDLLPHLIPLFAIMLDRFSRATYSEDGNFDWETTPSGFQSGDFATIFLGTLLHRVQSSFPRS